MIEFCSRTVRLSLRSDQNAFRIGTVRTTARGRFRFEWIPRRAEVGAGDWTLVARVRCESGKDGSPVPVRASTPLRIGAFNFVVGRGTTPKSRWLLYARRGRLGGYCVGVGATPPALDLSGRFWIAARDRMCDVVSAEAFGADGSSLGSQTPTPPRDC